MRASKVSGTTPAAQPPARSWLIPWISPWWTRSGMNLLFERFLNPGRISMPDIDLDFRDDRRAEMLEYTVNKYGQDKVAQIITFGTLGARAALRDVGRVMDIPLSEVDRVAKLDPEHPRQSRCQTSPRPSNKCPEFKAAYESADLPARADRHRRQNGRRGPQRRYACRRGGHLGSTPGRIPAAAPPHQQLRRDARSRPSRSSKWASSKSSRCSRWTSWAWPP